MLQLTTFFPFPFFTLLWLFDYCIACPTGLSSRKTESVFIPWNTAATQKSDAWVNEGGHDDSKKSCWLSTWYGAWHIAPSTDSLWVLYPSFNPPSSLEEILPVPISHPFPKLILRDPSQETFPEYPFWTRSFTQVPPQLAALLTIIGLASNISLSSPDCNPSGDQWPSQIWLGISSTWHTAWSIVGVQ